MLYKCKASVYVLMGFVALIFTSCLDFNKEERRTSGRKSVVDSRSNSSNADVTSDKVGFDDGLERNSPTGHDDFSWLATSRITKTDLDARGYVKADYRILRNAIFARHGYIFKSADLAEYFSRFSWYTPQYSDVNSMLSSIEQDNVATLKRLEKGVVTQQSAGSTYSTGDNPYLWLSQRKYENYEFYDMSASRETLRIWRNAIYARHGYIFKSADLANYFSQYSWYVPRYKDVTSKLSSIEAHNIRVLKRMYDNYQVP